MSAMLNAVLFDLDNTLVDRDRAFRDCVTTQFRDAAVQAELIGLDRGGYGDHAALFAAWERHSGGSMTQARFGEMIVERIRPDRALLDALRDLSATLKLAIITNGTSVTQRQKIHGAGLSEVISGERIWVSAEVGMKKPDPAIFHLACQSLCEYPENCLFIGDQAEIDVAGAAAAGMRTHLVDRVLDAGRLRELLGKETTQ